MPESPTTPKASSKPLAPLGTPEQVRKRHSSTTMTNDQLHQTLLLWRQMQRCIGYCSDVIPRCIPEKGVAWETLFDGIIENKKREPSILSAAP